MLFKRYSCKEHFKNGIWKGYNCYVIFVAENYLNGLIGNNFSELLSNIAHAYNKVKK